MDAAFGGFLLLEEIASHMAQNGKVLGSLVFADRARIFVEGDIQDPLQIIFDGPVLAHNV